MKPLPRTPLTEEDRAIFSRQLRTGRWPFCAHLEFRGRDHDRRDAELMLGLLKTRTQWFKRWLLRGVRRNAMLANQALYGGGGL